MNQSSQQFKHFIQIFLSLTLFVIFITGLINLIIDPIQVYQTPTFTHLNYHKTELGNYNSLYRALQISRLKPEGILLGSSRMSAGINPSDVEALTSVSCYNSGMNGATFDELYHYFEHALYHQPNLKLVIIGIDFFTFNQSIKPRSGFSIDRLKKRFYLTDYMDSLFSYTFLKCSLATLSNNFFHSDTFVHPVFLDNGLFNSSSAGSANPIIKNGHLWYLHSLLHSDYSQYTIDPKRIQLFRQLVKTCQERSIELRVFIPPAKAVYWEFIYRKGHWNVFEDLKRQLTTIYPIWDFSGFNCVTTESAQQESPFYYECSHFTPYLGKIILKTLFNKQTFIENFGYQHTVETIDDNLRQLREDSLPWLSTHHVMKDIDNWSSSLLKH